MSARSTNSVQVSVKVRPCGPGQKSLWQVREGHSIHLAESHANPQIFDHVFAEGVSNQEVFDRTARHIVHACLQGFNGTIFAYGQKSSGKTHTMSGDGQQPGIMVLSAKEIFQQIASEPDRDFLLRVGYIEICCEKICDLLNKRNKDLSIQESVSGIVKVNCEESFISSEDDLLRLLSAGSKERSNRSHAIFRITIESRKSDRSDDDVVLQSVLCLVDLAGSDTKETGLLALGNVIKSLSENVDSKLINFRESKLTRVLQSSLGGNALTSIICTIKPNFIKETEATLNFATRAKKIRIKPQVNTALSLGSMMKQLDSEIKALRDQLAEEEGKSESQLKVQDLDRRIKSGMLKIISSASLNEQRLQKRRRTFTCGSEGETAAAALPVLPEESRLPRPTKISQLPKPKHFAPSNFAHRRDTAFKGVGVCKSLKEECISANNVGAKAAIQIPLEVSRSPKKDQESVEKCDALQAEISALSASNRVANERIEEYEEQVKTLKETIARLEMEKSEAVNLGLRFESHKTKSKQVEEKLLSELSERDSTIEGLQQSLKELSREVLLNSKEDQMRSMCPELESSCEMICNKCHELGRLLPVADATELERIACQCDQLRSEIAATRIKLESVQEAFSQASCEVSQRTSDCERLTRQVSTAQDDFGLLQIRYNSLEQQWQDQQLAIATMQADYQAIQQKYQKLQDAYEELGQKSDDQCRQLQQDNTRLQGEIGTLKERVEEAQRKLMQAPDHEASAKDFKAENERLKVNLEELEAQFKGIQQEYDSLSNQLVESIQENDALREELKHRPARNFDVDSMKSSGVGTECSEPEHESDPGSDLLQQFVQLLESVQQIELQHNSAHSRLFRASRLERTQIVPSLKLCLGSAEFIEGDTAQLDDSVCLKGFLKRLRFRIVRLGEEQQSKDVVFQLEQDLIEKTMQVEAAEDTINQMSEQIQSLEAALLEKSSVVSMVEDYQLKIDSLEKQNAELQDKIAKESPTSDSLTEGDTLIGVPESPREDERELQEVASLKATLAELRAKVCDLQSELEGQLRQMQLKDGNIAKMQKEIEEMGKRCSSTGLRLVELEEDVRQKQDLLDRQTKKLSDGMILIDQLQERNAQLEDRNIKAEESLKRKEELEKEKWKQANLSSEQKKQIEELEESLGRAREELRKLEKVKTDEINALQLEFMVKLEESEIENRSKFRSYSLELEESKEGYDKTIATLKEQLSLVGEELSSVTAQCQEELKAIKGALEEKITQAEEERKTLAAQHQEELEKIKGMVKEKLEEAERKKANLEVDHKAELEKQKVEKQELEKLYQKSQGELQTQLRTREQNILEAQGGANEKIEELQTKYDQQVLELDKLKQEKMDLQSKIQDANAQHSSTLNNLVKLETEMAILTKQNVLQKCHFEEKMETFKLKINDLEEALHGAKLKLLRHEEMVSQHEQLKNCLTEANESSCNLQKKVERLRADLQTSQQETSNRAAEIEKLRSELKEAEDARTCVSADQLVLATQLKEVQEELSLQARKFQREVADLQGSIDELQLKLKSLQEIKDQLEIENGELKAGLEKEHKLCASLKENLAELEESKALLEEQMRAKEAEERTQELRSELETKSIESLESIIFDLQVNKRQLEEKLSILKGKDEENAILKVQLSSKEAALESLLADKCQMKENFGALKEELTKKCEELQSTLKCRETSLQNKSKQLELHLTILNEKDEDNARLEAQLASKEAELASLQPAVTHYKLAIETANNKVLEVGKKSDELTTECERLRSSLKSKEACLQKKKRMLKENITMLKQKDEECARLKDQLKSQGAALTSFQQAFTNLQSALDAANSRSLEMEKEVDDLTKECERLRVTLKSREASYRTEKVRMDGTISSLLEDKRNLEEKFCTVSEFSTKLESELAALQAVKLNGGNLLHESSSPTEAPSSASAHSSKKTKDRCGAGESGPKKSATIECAVRKNRRMTAYDEHRKQSFWIDSEDRGTMTESMTGDCNCSELNCKNRLNLNSRRS